MVFLALGERLGERLTECTLMFERGIETASNYHPTIVGRAQGDKCKVQRVYHFGKRI